MSIVKEFDEVITLKRRALQKMQGCQELIALISNNPNIDLDGEEAESVFDNNFYDYSFSDETFQTDKTVIFVESKLLKLPTNGIKMLNLYIQIVSNKDYVKLDKSIFTGVMGNRNDNIARQIVSLLNDSDYEDGIGDFELTEVTPKTVPQGFSSIMLEFEVADF